MSSDTFTPAKRRVGRRRHQEVPASSPPVVALNLVAAEFDETPRIVLTFDRAIDISAINVSAIVVNEGVGLGVIYTGAGVATLTTATTVNVPMIGTGDTFEPGVHLDAGAGNGIVAVDNSAPWAGAANLVLPFPG